MIPVYFPSSPVSSTGPSHILLELPTEILKLIDQASEDKPLSLTIKGRPSDEAVLCTTSKTYAIRSVQISNELVLFAPTTPSTTDTETGREKGLEMKDTLHEMLELSECVPKTGRIEGVLSGQEWEGLEEEREEGARPRKRTKYTLAHLKSIIQSSDSELVQALHEQNVLELNGLLLPLPPRQLYPLLSLLLRLLVLHCSEDQNPPLSVPTSRLLPALKEHGVAGVFAEAVLGRFGVFDGARGEAGREWTMGGEKGKEVVKEIGHGVLIGGLDPHDPIPLSTFLSLWSNLVPDVFQPLIALEDLSGSYLLSSPSPSTTTTITPFPLSHLPLDPASRFADLFLTRTRWLLKDMKPFLRDLAGDEKGRERLVARFGRVVRERVPVAPVAAGGKGGAKKEKSGHGGGVGGGAGGGEMVEVVYARNK